MRVTFALVLSVPLGNLLPGFAKSLAELGYPEFANYVRVRMEFCRLELTSDNMPDADMLDKTGRQLAAFFQERLFPEGDPGRIPAKLIGAVCDFELIQVDNWRPPEESHGAGEVASVRCPKCGSAMVLRRTTKSFWGCSAFPKCKGTRPVE